MNHAPISTEPPQTEYYVGLMSGTSLDGVDAVIAAFDGSRTARLVATHYQPYSASLRNRLLDLHHPIKDELHLANSMAIELADLYADCVHHLLLAHALPTQQIRALGCHGQTIRHRPESAYSVQLVSGARLAEKTGLTSIIDFRNRDISAGGQGAPLVPAFHLAQMHSEAEYRVIVNIGGIANLTCLPKHNPEHVTGFDCGPGNLLMDAWAQKHLGQPIDRNGDWAASGHVIPGLLSQFLAHDFFQLQPPKSAGREQFNLAWVESLLNGDEAPVDVQATLLELTAIGIVDAAKRYAQGYQAFYLCGGGVHNRTLAKRIAELSNKPTNSTAKLGLDPDWLEALAFAWLAKQCLDGRPANLPAVTGASGYRILGAIYPA